MSLTPDELDAIRDRNDTEIIRATHWEPASPSAKDAEALLDHIDAQDAEIATLIQQVRNQAAELEDTRAAYQLTRHQLDAHRAGQGTWVHEELGGHTEVIHDTTEGNTR